jgi:hypothetical protein
MEYIGVSVEIDLDSDSCGSYDSDKDVVKLGIAHENGHFELKGSKANIERILTDMQETLKEMTA